MAQTRRYCYVGPEDIRDRVMAPDAVRDRAVAPDAVAVDAPAHLHRWLSRQDREDLAEPLTFVVALDGVLRLAPRRSEHVALAAGQDVLAAGEMTFTLTGAGWRVAAVTNQSTGYCPDPDCWPAVAAALDRVGVPRPAGFTDQVVFRRCPSCGERNIVRDGDFSCALCDSALPTRWNLTAG